MRMRKKKWARPYIAERTDVVVAEPEKCRGKWKEILQAETIHLEIGSGKGSYWTGMAALYPEEGWIALEKSPDAAALGLKKCPDPSGNMKQIVGDAALLDEWFDDDEISVIHLNFSDPWPKKRNAKRRLSAPGFTDKYVRILKDGGLLVMKTDNTGLFEFSLEQIGAPFELVQMTNDFRAEEHPEDVITEYEQEFMDAGVKINRAVWKLRKEVLGD